MLVVCAREAHKICEVGHRPLPTPLALDIHHLHQAACKMTQKKNNQVNDNINAHEFQSDRKTPPRPANLNLRPPTPSRSHMSFLHVRSSRVQACTAKFYPAIPRRRSRA